MHRTGWLVNAHPAGYHDSATLLLPFYGQQAGYWVRGSDTDCGGDVRAVKVRIAVCVTPDGKWNSCGWSDCDDDDMMNLCLDGVESGETRYWVECLIELPEIKTITGTLSK